MDKKSNFNFSGLNLQEEFIGILDAENAEEYEDFRNAITEILTADDLDYNPDISKIIHSFAYSKAMKILNDGLREGFYHSTKGFSGETFSPSRFTSHQKDRWRLIFSNFSKETDSIKAEKYKKKYPKAIKYAKKYNINQNGQLTLTTSQSGNTLSLKQTFSWSEATRGLTQKSVRDQLKAGVITDREVDLINLKVTNAIVSKVKGDQQLIRAIINHILRENKYVFFVGRNTKDITGILGEISGLYYISKFFGGFSQKVIQWAGGTYTGEKGTKPHRDIILKDLGIQVKNSIEEDLGVISFAEAGIETMLNKTDMPQQGKDLFLNYYGTLSFNIPYYWEKGKYKAGTPSNPTDDLKDFIKNRENLVNVKDYIEQLLSLSAAYFMYMDIYTKSSNIDANVLYLLGGKTFQTASQILSDIKDQLYQEERNFKIRASYKDDRNIVTALNENSKAPDYSSTVISNIELKSSYNFKPKIKT